MPKTCCCTLYTAKYSNRFASQWHGLSVSPLPLTTGNRVIDAFWSNQNTANDNLSTDNTEAVQRALPQGPVSLEPRSVPVFEGFLSEKLNLWVIQCKRVRLYPTVEIEQIYAHCWLWGWVGFEVFLKWGEQRECGSEPESIKTVWNKSPSLTHTDDAEGFIVLSEVSQTEKDKCIISYMWCLKHTHTHTPTPWEQRAHRLWPEAGVGGVREMGEL